MTITEGDLVGKYCMTQICVPGSGQMLAWPGEIITEAKAKEIARVKTVMDDLVLGIRKGDIIQRTYAMKGFVDSTGRVY